MATGKSAEVAPGAPAGPGAASGWAFIVAGTALSAGWIFEAQRMAELVPMDSIGKGVSIYYAMVFGPLLLFAVLFGWLSKVRLFAAGKAPQAWIPAGLALGGGGFLATLGMSALNGGLVNGPASDSGMGLVALGVLLTLFQTYSEELLFRGWLQQALSARVGQVAAVLLGAMLFGAFHILGGARGAVPLLNLALGGVWFGLLALRSGSVLAPLGAHFAWNAIEDLGFGLVPNPGTGPLGSFWNKDLAGPAWWGGVEDGLNASIGTTVVLVALILPLLQPRREPAAAPATA